MARYTYQFLAPVEGFSRDFFALSGQKKCLLGFFDQLVVTLITFSSSFSPFENNP